MFPIRQPGQYYETAERKGRERGLAAVDPNRVINVNLSSFSAPPESLGIPRWITISTKQSATVHEVLTEIHGRLPKIDYPFTISTMGADPQELRLGGESRIQWLLPKYDSTSLTLRLHIDLPKSPKEPKRGLGSKLRSVLGTGSSRSEVVQPGQRAVQDRPEANDSRFSIGSAPPSYDDAVRTGT